MKKLLLTLIVLSSCLLGVKAGEIEDYKVDFTQKGKSTIGWKADIIQDDWITADADGLHLYNPEVRETNSNYQLILFSDVYLEVGVNYTIKIVAKVSNDSAQVRCIIGDYSDGIKGTIVVNSTEYKEYTITGSAPVAKCYFNAMFGHYVGTVSFKSITITHDGNVYPMVWVEQLTNGNAEKTWADLGLANIKYDDEENFFKICAWSKEKGVNMNADGKWKAFPARIEVDPTDANNHIFVVHGQIADTEGDASEWDNQFWIMSPKPWKAGTRLRIQFRYRCYGASSVRTRTEIHKNPENYFSYNPIGYITFTEEWQTFDKKININTYMNGGWSIAFSLNSEIKYPVDFYFDDLSLQSEEIDNSPEKLIQYLTELLETTTNAIEALTYAVPGKAVLEALVAEASTATVETDANQLLAYITQLQEQTSIVVALDGQYKKLADLITTMNTTVENNPHADEIDLAEATALAQEIEAGLQAGNYSASDIEQLIASLNNYIIELSEISLTINVEEAGSLGDLVLEKGVEFNDVIRLRISGRLNATDLNTLKSFNKLQWLDLSETNITTIANEQFKNKNYLKKVVLPNKTTIIGSNAFYGCGALEEVIIPATIQMIGDYAFYGCQGLWGINLPVGLSSIGASAFYNCSSLKTLELPKGLISINSNAFSGCSSLETIELPEGLTSINSNAFQGTSLEEVVLPSSLQTINSPFSSCSKLKTITIKAFTAPDTNNNPVASNANNVKLLVPNLSLNVYKQAAYWNDFNIEGADIMPENITINTDYRMNWSESQTLNYSPNIYITPFASLWISGNSALSANNFTLAYDYRYNSFASLLSHSPAISANNVAIDVTTTANRWYFMSMPFDVKVSDIGLMFAGTPYAIRKYDGNKRAQGLTDETWVNIGNDETISAYQGFILQSASTDSNRSYNGFTFSAVNNEKKNNIFANDDIEVELTEFSSEFEHNRSWNLIGNPYPTYYDIRAMKTTAPIIIWNYSNNNYQAYSPVDDAYILNPGQAFFIQRPINDGETLTFQKQGRQIDIEVRPAEDVTNRAPKLDERSVFNLTINGSEMSDRTRFVINNSAKMSYESSRDASKFMSDAQSIQLYTIQNGVKFAINERPLGNAIIELGMLISKAGNYTIALSTTIDNEVYLIDRLTGQEIRLDGSEGYHFNAEQGTIEGRFAIRLGSGEATGIKSMEHKTNNSEMYYDLQGRKTERPAKGVYIKNSKKVVIK